MKSDKDFIDSVYKKAQILKNEKHKQKKLVIIKNIYVGVIAASFIVVFSVSAMNNKNKNIIDVDTQIMKTNDLSISKSVFKGFNPENAISNTSIIITAKVVKINKGIYDENTSNIITNVTIHPTKIYKGDIREDDFDINIIGGKDEVTNHFQEYEVSFKPNEDVLLLLSEDFDGVYTLAYGINGKYTYLENQEDLILYQSDDGHIITTNMLN